MMGVEHYIDHLEAPAILAALLDEFSAVTDYRTLRDNLPRRLAHLLKCRCVLLYQRIGETLQFAAGSFADQPGWSSALLAVAHINPIESGGDVLEARAWRTRRAITAPLTGGAQAAVCTPLIYRQRAIGVLTAIRGMAGVAGEEEISAGPATPCWQPDEISLVTVAANVVAMLLENTRLLERDRARIHELSLLNGITSQMNSSLRDRARVFRVVIQRAREISMPDLCEVLVPGVVSEASWIPPKLQDLLLQRWLSELHSAPLVLERSSARQAGEYLDQLDSSVKTFFALPLVGKSSGNCARGGPAFAPSAQEGGEEQRTRVFGVIVGAYHKPWKLRREELFLLQILANQASVVLQNITLVEEVVEARNEARRLLRQVLDDQRLKELILESIPSGLITINLRGQITTFNRAAEAVLGYHPREVVGQSALKVLNLRNLDRVLQTGQPQHETLLTSGHQGQEIALDINLILLCDDHGQPMGVLVTFADITGIYHLEEEKRRLDRLASLGEMSASVAHEVRNPLASIKTSMQMLLDDLGSDSTLQADQGSRDEISVVLKEVERLDTIVRDLLLFARPRQLHLVECDLSELSARLLRFLLPQCEERGVRVRLVRQALPRLLVDVAQIEQVLMNLFLNALQAMPDGGLLSVTCQTIRTPTWKKLTDWRADRRSTKSLLAQAEILTAPGGEREAEHEQEEVHERAYGEQDQQDWLELVVSDTGTGIAQDALERIFQPFYTTKAHGIGLGLPISRRLIEDHKGYLLVESQLGYGTTVSVRLPLISDVLAQEKQSVEGGSKRCEPDDSDC